MKLILDIETGSNGGYVVTWHKSNPNALQQLGGSKPEKEVLAFSNSESLVKWINERR